MGVSFEDVVLAEVLVSGMVPPIGKNTYHSRICRIVSFSNSGFLNYYYIT